MDTTDTPPLPECPVNAGRIISHFIFGIFLPIFTLGFEIINGLSDLIYIDPIPTLSHVIIVGLVPLLIAINLFRLARNSPVSSWDLHLNGLCVSISTIYSIIYLPIAPFAVVGIIAYGLGFLPLSPIIAFISAYRLRKEMKRRLPDESPATFRQFYIGFSIGLGLLLLASTPKILTDYAITQYINTDGEKQASAIRTLRTFANEKALLNACYRQSDQIFFRGSGDNSLEIEEARQLYYRVTGETFNSQRKTKEFMPTTRGSWDRDLGGEHVGQTIKEVALEESRLDGIVDPNFGTGYVEWTMVFRNDHRWNQHEARMLISMPKGGVASRVTLWVNGEPREAAFGSKAKVRAAYENVAVRQRRDPILVNWAGPDLLLAQCFPIPANGGTMKVRIGISFPLETNESGALSFHYPTIVAHNFTLPEQLRHSVWYEEKTTNGIQSYPLADYTNEALGSMCNTTLSPRSLQVNQFTSAHPTQKDQSLSFKVHAQDNTTVHQPDAIVIDGSNSMKAQVTPISKWLSQHSGAIELFLATDKVLHFKGNGAACAQWLQKQHFVGGQDNAPALTQAIRKLKDSATADTPQNIYWFSGPQPIQLSGTETIRQAFERRELNINITACLTSRDYNALYELAPLSYSETLYLNKSGTLENPTIQFTAIPDQPATIEGPSHAYRVWLAGQTRTLANQTYRKQAALGPTTFQTEIAHLANRAAKGYIVTQLSGAVVLETDQQYTDNDLEAGDPNSVPTVPEAKHYALILGICSLAYIGSSRARYRRKANHLRKCRSIQILPTLY